MKECHGSGSAPAKCAALEAVENGITIARELGVTDPRDTLLIVLGHLRTRFPDVTAALHRVANGV